MLRQATDPTLGVIKGSYLPHSQICIQVQSFTHDIPLRELSPLSCYFPFIRIRFIILPMIFFKCVQIYALYDYMMESLSLDQFQHNW
jgi:hypothetical protein